MDIKGCRDATLVAVEKEETEEEKKKVAIALEKLGKAYLKIPRTLLDWLSNPDKHKRNIGRLYTLLFTHCNFADGMVHVGGQAVLCREGEFIATYQDLADMSGISVRSVSDYVKYLVAESLIGVKMVAKRSCFVVYGYKQYMHDTKWTKKELNAVKNSTTASAEKSPSTGSKEKSGRGRRPRYDLLD